MPEPLMVTDPEAAAGFVIMRGRGQFSRQALTGEMGL
jgi:hypothetical protein